MMPLRLSLSLPLSVDDALSPDSWRTRRYTEFLFGFTGASREKQYERELADCYRGLWLPPPPAPCRFLLIYLFARKTRDYKSHARETHRELFWGRASRSGSAGEELRILGSTRTLIARNCELQSRKENTRIQWLKAVVNDGLDWNLNSISA